MANQVKALAVIQRASGASNIYEAWLHHQPKIFSRSVGIRWTKDLLQFEANRSPDFPSYQVSPQDIQAAIATEGREVMVYYVTKGDPIALPKRPFDAETNFFDVEEESFEREEPPKSVIPRRDPSKIPMPPLPPILEPVIENSDEILLCISMMDAEYRHMIAGVLAPERKSNFVLTERAFGKHAFQGSAEKVEISKPTYAKITTEFALSCNNATRVLSTNFKNLK